jgi:transcriptional regulator
MYIPSYFQMEEAHAFDLIEAHSFGTLVSLQENEPFATHLPMLLDRETRTLWGHVARSNPQWRNIEGQTVLAMFMGDHHYISPTWYESRDHVPTWNYSAVHVYGSATLDNDPEYVLAMLRKLIQTHEHNGSVSDLSDVSGENLNGLLKGIAAFTIQIERVEAKSKMSQNHPKERRTSVVEALRELGTDTAIGVAQEMSQ